MFNRYHSLHDTPLINDKGLRCSGLYGNDKITESSDKFTIEIESPFHVEKNNVFLYIDKDKLSVKILTMSNCLSHDCMFKLPSCVDKGKISFIVSNCGMIVSVYIPKIIT